MIDLYQLVSSLQNEKRYNHTLGVINMAKHLAETYNVQVDKCELAALLHDVTKQIDNDTHQQLLSQVDDQFIVSQPPLWHSYTGAIYAKEQLGITDGQVLDAIKWHTTGKVTTDPIAQVIYISDYLELGRSFTHLNSLRDMIGTTSLSLLYKAVAKYRIEYELNQGHILHPDTRELYESIV